MKKLISLLTALVLMLSVCAVSFAEDYAVVTYAEPSYEGAWYSFGDAFYFNLPVEWQMVEVSNEDYDTGIRFWAATEDSSKMFFITHTTAEEHAGAANVTDRAAVLKEQGIESELVEVNGVPVVRYVDESNIAYMEFFTVDGDSYSFAIYPMDESQKNMIAELEATFLTDISELGDITVVNAEKAVVMNLGDAFMTIWRFFTGGGQS